MTDKINQDPLNPADIRDGLQFAAAMLVGDRDRMDELMLLGNKSEMLRVNTSVLNGLAQRVNGSDEAALAFFGSVLVAHPESRS